MRKPIIGITLDHEIPVHEKAYSPFPYYALRENYVTSITQAGAIPLLLPHDTMLVDEYAGMLDGLVITGGDFDIDPSYYGDDSKHETVVIKDQRTQFEWKLTEAMLRDKKPLLGICGGQQLLNVVCGGTLIQHIPDVVESDIEHEQTTPRTEFAHAVTITSDTLLHKIVGKTDMRVNSGHHQAVDKVAEVMVVNALSPDGVIEGIEHKEQPFCLGVQWHPEYILSAGDASIFDAFIKAAQA